MWHIVQRGGEADVLGYDKKNVLFSWGKGEGVGKGLQEILPSSCPHDRQKSGAIAVYTLPFLMFLCSFHLVFYLLSTKFIYKTEEALHR